MTTAIKIHYRDATNTKGVACGKTVDKSRITDDPDAVTCVVCRTFSAAGRKAAAAPRRGRRTVLDALTEPVGALPNLAGIDPARDLALRELAARHLDEFLELYRAELNPTATNGA